ncbi:MAG: flippase-like domain-containing protein [Candidatus Dormibacteraeota bacterium]|nr:flippase-like domain-containing protein [Candidatus Dormibacteraeota bacterium]MBO0762272.1 flippase-like domain-containing protein [Candidatus Dormibacteraeota bacterium]
MAPDVSGRLIRAAEFVEGVADTHPRLGRVLRWLRGHWLEAIAIVSLVAVIVAVDPSKLIATYGRVTLPPLLLMLPTVLAVYVLRGIGWWVALRHLGVEIGPLRAVAIMFAGQTLIFMPAGDLARVALVERTGASGRDEGTLAGSIAFQELLFLTLLGLGALGQAFTELRITLLVLVLVAAQAGIFVILLVEPVYRWAVGLVERFRLLRRFDSQLRSLRPAFLAMLAPRPLLGVLGCNAAAALGMFVLFWLALRAVDVTRVGLGQAAFVYGLAHILSGVSFLPGGVGSMEALTVGLLASRGVAPPVGAAAAVLFRACNDALMALVGVGAGVVLRREGSELDRVP